MTDELSKALDTIMRPGFGKSAEVHYTYTPEQEAARAQIIKQIEVEKVAYLERVEPLLRLLGNIQGTPHIIVQTAAR